MSTRDTEPRLLLIVEAAFQLTDGRVIIVPGPPFDTFGHEGTHSCAVRIVRPDGSTLTVQAHFYVGFYNTTDVEALLRLPEHACYECVLIGITKDEVPIGSEIYEIDNVEFRSLSHDP